MDRMVRRHTEVNSDLHFREVNEGLARDFWYLTVTFLTACFVWRVLVRGWLALRLRPPLQSSTQNFHKPHNVATQTVVAISDLLRGITYLQLYFLGTFSWLSPPPLGSTSLLLCYWAVVTYMLTTNAIINDISYYERIGFRAAWISLAQVPFVYLLSSKASFSAWLVGTSYEKINWLHRWVSRTLLLAVTIHGAFFVREWVLADFFALELAMMPMVKYGLGAWFILVWMCLSSLAPLRRIAYEFFVLQHMVAAVVFLLLVWVHVPKHAGYFVWFALGVVSLDWLCRCFILVYQNTHKGGIGYRAQLRSNGADVTIITMKDVPLSWSPGQHFRLWIPRLGLFESHPFTTASLPVSPIRGARNKVQLAVVARSGFTKRVLQYAQTTQQDGSTTALRAFLSGPFGPTFNLNSFETLVFVSASTGTSYTMAMLEKVLQNSADRTCIRRVHYLISARKRADIDFYTQKLPNLLSRAREKEMELSVEVAITRESIEMENLLSSTENVDGEKHDSFDFEQVILFDNEESDEERLMKTEASLPSSQEQYAHPNASERKASGNRLEQDSITYSSGRRSIRDFIQNSVELSRGEIVIVVCGGRSLVGDVRNCVAKLSSRRSLNRETRSQGIHLLTEEYTL